MNEGEHVVVPGPKSHFAPEALDVGAILPAEGRDAIIRSAGLPTGALEAEQDGWLTPEIPVLVRGAVKILPVAWRGDPASGYNPYAEPQQITTFASHVQGAGTHRAGPWTLLDLDERRDDSIGSYAEALKAAGATRVDCWVYSDALGLSLVWAGEEQLGTKSLAIHLVPASWVFERGAGEAVTGIDVSWSWADVIDLNRDR